MKTTPGLTPRVGDTCVTKDGQEFVVTRLESHFGEDFVQDEHGSPHEVFDLAIVRRITPGRPTPAAPKSLDEVLAELAARNTTFAAVKAKLQDAYTLNLRYTRAAGAELIRESIALIDEAAAYKQVMDKTKTLTPPLRDGDTCRDGNGPVFTIDALFSSFGKDYAIDEDGGVHHLSDLTLVHLNENPSSTANYDTDTADEAIKESAYRRGWTAARDAAWADDPRNPNPHPAKFLEDLIAEGAHR